MQGGVRMTLTSRASEARAWQPAARHVLLLPAPGHGAVRREGHTVQLVAREVEAGLAMEPLVELYGGCMVVLKIL